MKRVSALLIMSVIAGLLATAAPAAATNIGNEGCTPGYWKNHHENWEEYQPTTRLSAMAVNFGPQLSHMSTVTFAEALEFGGGPGIEGAAKILLRAAAAAYLNAAHEGLGYPYRRFMEPFNIREQLNAAFASGDRATMLTLAGTLDSANNLGCPL